MPYCFSAVLYLKTPFEKLWKSLFVIHRYQNVVKLWKSCYKLWKTYLFFMIRIISLISLSKLGSDAIRFSTASIELIIVV